MRMKRGSSKQQTEKTREKRKKEKRQQYRNHVNIEKLFPISFLPMPSLLFSSIN